MPAGKIAKIKTVESWPVTPLTGSHGAGRSVGITLDRELFIERGDVIAHAGATPRDTRRIRARIFWLHDKPLSKGDQILIRLGTRETRASVVAIEKAVDPGELSNEETKAIARNHVGEIDISLAQPIAADPYQENPRTGRLVIEVNGRIAGGGLVLSVDAGQRAVPIDIVPVESALRPEERSARYHHNGAVIWLTGLPGSGKSTLARALERRLFSRGGSPILLDGDTLRAGLNGDLGFLRRTAAKTFVASRKSPPIWRATVTSRSSPRFRLRSRIAPRRGASPTPRSAKSTSPPPPKYARAATPRATTPRPAPARCRRSPESRTTTSRRRNAN